jgi:hypothetical protein
MQSEAGGSKHIRDGHRRSTNHKAQTLELPDTAAKKGTKPEA